MNTLGLDISTSCVGVTVLDKDGNLVVCESWDLRKTDKDLLFKAEFIEEKLRNIKQQIGFIMIEEPLQRFLPGRSSIKTILKLAKFNAIISYICKNMYGVVPEYVSANSSRKKCGIVTPKGCNVKMVVVEHFLKTEPKFTVEYTRHGNPIHGTFDRADSLVVAKVGYDIWKAKNSES